MKGLPKGVWFTKKRLSDGAKVRYGYYGRGAGTVALGREGTPEFHERLADALRREPKTGTLNSLIWAYKQSTEFARLAPRTRSDYMRQLDKIMVKFGLLSFRALMAREIIPHFFKWRDEMSNSAKQANYAISVLKLVLAWGVKRGYLDKNLAAGVGKLEEGDRREHSWTEADIAAFMAKAPEPLQRAMILAVETGQRQADLLTLTWTALSDGIVSLKQGKGGVYASVPVSATLEACLSAAPRGKAVTILTRADGLPWEPKGNGFRAAWRGVCVKAGITDLTFHDLRGTFVTRRLAEGWSPQDVAGCTGHSLRNMAMLDRYADREKVAKASAARIKNRGKEIEK